MFATLENESHATDVRNLEHPRLGGFRCSGNFHLLVVLS